MDRHSCYNVCQIKKGKSTCLEGVIAPKMVRKHARRRRMVAFSPIECWEKKNKLYVSNTSHLRSLYYSIFKKIYIFKKHPKCKEPDGAKHIFSRVCNENDASLD